MKKKIVIFLLAGTLGLSLAGCSASSEKTQTQGAANEAEDQVAGVEDTGASETEIQTAVESSDETEPSIEPITPSEYLIEDAADYVTLGDYAGIPVEKTNYEVTDEMIQERIDEELESYAEEEEVDRAAQEEDTVYGNLSYVIPDTEETYNEEDAFLTIGYEEYGAEFDEKMIGASKGDKLEFSIDYPEDSDMIEFAGKTVDFVFEVTSVTSMNVPEYNEEFVTDTVGFETMDEYEQYIRESLTREYEEISYIDMIDTLFDEAVSRTEFKGYPQEAYDAYRKETVDFYMLYSGAEAEDEIYNRFGLTKEDIEEEVLATINRRLLISAYFLANDIEVTEEDYMAYLEGQAALYDEPDAAFFESTNGRDTIVWSLFESKFTDALYEQADITEVTYDPSAEESESYLEEE